jgi:type IV secretion system protein VirB9
MIHLVASHHAGLGPVNRGLHAPKPRRWAIGAIAATLVGAAGALQAQSLPAPGAVPKPATKAVTEARADQPAFGRASADASAEADLNVSQPGESRAVVFTFADAQAYTILTQVGMSTRIALADDEDLITKPALGNSAPWRVGLGERSIVVRPLRFGGVTTLTLETSKRTYDIQLVSGQPGGRWYRTVRWDYPEEMALRARKREEAREVFARDQAAQMRERQRLDSQVLASGNAVDQLNWGYDVKGDASFKPLGVFDDGKQTYIRLDAQAPVPVVLVVEGKQRSLVNHLMRDGMLIVQRLADELVLKRDKDEVRIVRKNPQRRGVAESMSVRHGEAQ